MRTRVALVLLLVLTSGCDRICGLLGPRWTPDSVAGTYDEVRDDGKKKAKLVVTSAATRDETDDGDLIHATFDPGDPRSGDEAVVVRDIDPAKLAASTVDGVVAGFDIDADDADVCGKDTVVDATGDNDAGDLDADGFNEIYRVSLRAFIAGGSDQLQGDLSVEVPRSGTEPTSTSVPIAFVREEGPMSRPLCRDDSDDNGPSEDRAGDSDGD